MIGRGKALKKNMAAETQSNDYVLYLVSSMTLNLALILYMFMGSDRNLSWSSRASKEAEVVSAIFCHGRAYLDGKELASEYNGSNCSPFPLSGCVSDAHSDWNLSWSSKAAKEAEVVAAISCSGHGRAYVDGVALGGNKEHLPACECNTCYQGPDCSQFSLEDCVANADSGDPYFLEPFWMKHAASSAILISGWHRMSYSYEKDRDDSYISEELVSYIRKLHAVVGNAVTENKFIFFGAGSTQLLNAAVYALSPQNSSSSPASVVVSFPFYPVYQMQTEYFQSLDFKFAGDASLWKKNSSDTNMSFVEFVTTPNNPDGKMNTAILNGPNAKALHDYAYYWPNYAPILAPADEDLMIFTISKFTGHAGARFGWAVVKDEAVYERMMRYMDVNTLGVSRDTQLRVLKLLKVVLEGDGKEMFEFAYETMKNRWDKLNKIMSLSNRFLLQESEPGQHCTFFQKIRSFTPAYAWVKCIREEDEDCYEVLKAAKIIGREGSYFYAENRYVRLSLIKGQDDFDHLMYRLNELILEE